MTVFQGAVDATFAAFGIDAVYTPAVGDPIPVRVIARRPDTIVGFGDTRIHAATATFEVRASEVASLRPGDQLTVGGESFVIQGEPERRDPDRLGLWMCGRREQPCSRRPWTPLNHQPCNSRHDADHQHDPVEGHRGLVGSRSGLGRSGGS
jgi:hypothetical protein